MRRRKAAGAPRRSRLTLAFSSATVARRLLAIAFRPARRRAFARVIKSHPAGGVYFDHKAWRLSSRAAAERMQFGARAQLMFRARRPRDLVAVRIVVAPR